MSVSDDDKEAIYNAHMQLIKDREEAVRVHDKMVLTSVREEDRHHILDLIRQREEWKNEANMAVCAELDFMEAHDLARHHLRLLVEAIQSDPVFRKMPSDTPLAEAVEEAGKYLDPR